MHARGTYAKEHPVSKSYFLYMLKQNMNNDNNNNNKYISKALNPSSDLHEAQSTVHVQLKPSKQSNQRHQEKSGDGRGKKHGSSINYTTNYTWHNSLSLSLHLSSYHSPSLCLPFTDRSAIQRAAVHENKTNKYKSPPGDPGSSEKAEVKSKVLREVSNCERELLCRMWEGRLLFLTRGA